MFHDLYVTAELVETRYWSHRTEFKKLRDRIKNSKSGEGGTGIQVTDLMKWKLRRWAFLDPFIQIKKATYSQELGKVSIAFDEFPSCMASFSSFLLPAIHIWRKRYLCNATILV